MDVVAFAQWSVKRTTGNESMTTVFTNVYCKRTNISTIFMHRSRICVSLNGLTGAKMEVSCPASCRGNTKRALANQMVARLTAVKREDRQE